MIQQDRKHGKREVIALLQSARLKQAAKLVKSLAGKSPKDPSLRFLSGLVALAQENKPLAIKSFSNAIKLGSNDVGAFINLATLQMSMNALPAAGKTLALAARKFGDANLQITHLTASLRISEDRYADAIALAEKCIEIDPRHADGWVLKGQVLRRQGHLFDAIESFQRAVEIDPMHADAFISLSWLLSITNQTDTALQVTQQAVQRIPNSADLHAQLAQRYVEAGLFSEAIEAFQTLGNDPSQAPAALRMLAQLLPEDALPPVIEHAKKIARTSKDPEALGQLHLALHTAHKRAKLKGPQKISLGAANSLFARARPYSADGDAAYHSEIKAAFASDLKVNSSDKKTSAPVPIFIVGMIRSGTTLLERMLSNHPDVGSLGEVALVGRTIDRAIHEGEDLSTTLSGLADRYSAYQAVAGEKAFTTDKMPNNYLYIGYLRQAFPNCKIILIKRDFRDIAISAFENYFDSPALNFSYSEAGILNRLRLFADMTSHWAGMSDIHTVWYEDLVAKPEQELQRLSEYCGFDLRPDMIHPEQAKAGIRTASHSQARKPIYTSSQNRWKDDVVAEYLPSVVNETDNSTVAWRVAWLEELRQRQFRAG